MSDGNAPDDDADVVEREDDPDLPKPPEACPRCGNSALTDLWKKVTATVSEFHEYACEDCDWSGAPPWRCGSEDTSDGSACRNPVSDPSEQCHYHPVDSDEPDVDGDPGAPEGNDNAVGNNGGAPEGNTNAMKSGRYMTLKRRLDTFNEQQRQRFESHYTDFMRKAENQGTAIALATAEVLRESVADRLIEADRDGELWEEIPVVDDDGEPIIDPDTGEPVKKERLRRDDIDALKGLMSELRLGKKYEGINDNAGDSSAAGHGNANLLWDADDGADAADHDVVPSGDADDRTGDS
jgi:hypothetical protein